MTRVVSSNLYAVGYNGALKVLTIQFRNGSVYEYYNVPEMVYRALMSATSKGVYASRYIYRRYLQSKIR